LSIEGDELAIDGLQDFAKHGLDRREEIFCRFSAQIGDASVVEAKAIAQ